MAGHVLELRGCTPEPLGNYLKGLGVFRLIAEQADPQARAWWEGGVLRVFQQKWLDKETAKSKLAEWLLTDCRFTPLIAPWQKGTGYLPIGKRAAGGIALKDLLASEHNGTDYFREVFRGFAETLGISLSSNATDWPEQMRGVNVELTDAQLLRVLRNRMRSSVGLKWLDAVGMVIARTKNSDAPKWFPLLASGGGEASGQYIVNHQQRLQTVLLCDRQSSWAQLLSCLYSENHLGTLEANSMGAMYYPSLMKVPNAGQGFLPDPQRRVNPWDFILLLEGSLVWSLAATKREGVTSERASFPFYCRGSFGGSTTIGPKEVEGAEKSIAKGELWCPTWACPSMLTEIERIFGEGRIQVGDKPVSRSLDFALAMSGLGVDRGIQAFHRYSLLERSGSGRQRTLLAVSNGIFVPNRRSELALLAELRPFAESIVSNLADSSQQPRRLINARIDFEGRWYDATTASATDSTALVPSHCLAVLVSAGRLMRELGTDRQKPGVVKFKTGEKTVERKIPPLGSLDSAWHNFLHAPQHDAVLRLALAIAGIVAWGESSDLDQPAVEAIRANLLPLRRNGKSWQWEGTCRSAVWSRGASLASNLAAVLRRRLIDAQRESGDGLPLWSPDGATFADLLHYWHEEVDEEQLAELIHGLALIDSGLWKLARINARQAREETPNLKTSAVWLDKDERKFRMDLPHWLSEKEFGSATALPRVYHLLKLCFLGGRLPRRPVEGWTIRRDGTEPYPPTCLDILSLLEAGRLPEAAQVAARRLRAKGYPAILRDLDLIALDMDLNDCRRLAGLLLIPVLQPGVLAALAVKPESTVS